MFYAAKCYWPGITEAELEHVAARAALEAQRTGGSADEVAYVGSMLFPDDALVLCLFEASSRVVVHEAARRAGIPCERVMDSVWIACRGLEKSTQ